MTMKSVKIAHLKSHLSQHLREVRGGRTLTVLDRNTPVAKLVPIASDDDVVITPPAAPVPSLAKVKLPAPVRIQVDVVDLLLEDRRKRA
jgi:antitoxin (DNA-binding transcriptional repressor) of toxin-antitoxin stability system